MKSNLDGSTIARGSGRSDWPGRSEPARVLGRGERETSPGEPTYRCGMRGRG